MANQIKFSHNWNNKLDNDIFTTIRKSNYEKDRYYHSKVGKTFEVLLNGEEVCKAKLWNIDTRPFVECDCYLLMLDTGEINTPKQFDIFRKFGVELEKDDVIILTFQRLKRRKADSF